MYQNERFELNKETLSAEVGRLTRIDMLHLQSYMDGMSPNPGNCDGMREETSPLRLGANLTGQIQFDSANHRSPLKPLHMLPRQLGWFRHGCRVGLGGGTLRYPGQVALVHGLIRQLVPAGKMKLNHLSGLSLQPTLQSSYSSPNVSGVGG